MSVFPSKSLRAKAILDQIICAEGGPYHPDMRALRERHHVEHDPRWSAIVTPGIRVTVGRIYEDPRNTSVGSRCLEDSGSMMVELRIHGQRTLVANLKDDDVEIHLYIPGQWEAWFGQATGDTQPYERLAEYDRKSPKWQELEASADYHLSPERSGSDDDVLAGNRRHRRRMRPMGI